MNTHAKLHLGLTVAWVLMIPLSLATGWIYNIVFVSAISLYANIAGHWSAYEASTPTEAE